MRTRWLGILLCVFLGCASPSEKKRAKKVDQWMCQNDAIKVLSTTAMVNQLVRMVGGDRVDCLSLIVGNVDPHHYELVKGDREKLDCADLIVSNGVGLECGASLRYALEHHPKTLFLGDAIFNHHPEAAIWIEGVIDPHIWMDIGLFALGIDPIVEALSQLDPAGARLYRQRGAHLKHQMEDFDRLLQQKMRTIPEEKRFLVTSHDAFHYFTRKYLAAPNERHWAQRTLAPEGLVPDGQLSALDIQEVCDFLCSHRLGVVFSESNVSQSALQKVIASCREKGLDVTLASTPLYGDAMSETGDEEGAYFRMIEHNVNTLVHFLIKSES
ncbi:MAG: zinc ABC transporter substrate-binding protein [Chlamydiota bacterium]